MLSHRMLVIRTVAKIGDLAIISSGGTMFSMTSAILSELMA